MRLSLPPLALLCIGTSSCASKERPPDPAEAVASATQTARSSAAPPLKSSAPPAPAPPVKAEPRVYAKSRFVWIVPQPGGEGWIGYLWLGGSAKLRPLEPVIANGCTKWVAIEPRGWVCADGVRATTDADDPAVKVVKKYGPRLDTPWPHEYGESRGVQRYKTLPSASEQRGREWDLPEHIARVEKARSGAQRHSSLEGVNLDPAPELPIVLGDLPGTAHEPRKRLLPTSTVSWIAEQRHEGRDFLLSGDLMWTPKDRVATYKKVMFSGVHLGKDAQLPLAFFRGKDRPRYQLRGQSMVEATPAFTRLSWVALSGREQSVDGETYLETRDGKGWMKKSDAVVPTPQEKTPWGAPVGGADTDAAPKGRRTWLEASIWGGWMIAYEGTQPIYATMISPGRGGTPVPGKDPLETASTPTGTFKITGKFATATMEAPGEYIHIDVPWTQNFSGPHALHGAYWHDDWGNKKSAGCVNVSPIDGKWLYEWTEPRVPDGWHAVRWSPTTEPATTYVVHH